MFTLSSRKVQAEKPEPHHYWNYVAYTKLQARILAAKLGLTFPNIGSTTASMAARRRSGLIYPIRRLVATGEDNTFNMQNLLGPLWEQEAGFIKQVRIEILLSPSPGSPSYQKSNHLDVGLPRWTPRGPNAEEEEAMARMRDEEGQAAALVADQKHLTAEDIEDVLKGLGDNWAQALPAFQAAMTRHEQETRA